MGKSENSVSGELSASPGGVDFSVVVTVSEVPGGGSGVPGGVGPSLPGPPPSPDDSVSEDWDIVRRVSLASPWRSGRPGTRLGDLEPVEDGEVPPYV